MVRGLVEQQQIRVAEQQARQRRAGLLPAGEIRRRPIPLVALEAQAGKGRLDPLVERISVSDGKLVLQLLVFRFGHPAGMFELSKGSLELLQPSGTRSNGQPQARRLDEARVDVRLLTEHGDRQAAFAMDLAQIGLVEAGHEPQQGRLPRAIGADEADSVASGDGRVDVVEDHEIADLANDPSQPHDRHQAAPPAPRAGAVAPPRAAARRVAAAFRLAAIRRCRWAAFASSSLVRPSAPSPESSVQREPRRIGVGATWFADRSSAAAAALCSAGSRWHHEQK